MDRGDIPSISLSHVRFVFSCFLSGFRMVTIAFLRTIVALPLGFQYPVCGTYPPIREVSLHMYSDSYRVPGTSPSITKVIQVGPTLKVLHLIKRNGHRSRFMMNRFIECELIFRIITGLLILCLREQRLDPSLIVRKCEYDESKRSIKVIVILDFHICPNISWDFKTSCREL